MRVALKWMVLGLFLTVLAIAGTPAATAQTPVTLTVFDPTGAFEVTQTFAPRVADLNGKTICQLSDDMWEAYRTFPLIAQLLQRQFPTIKIVPNTEFASGTDGIDSDKTAQQVKDKGCQAVIVGNAG